MSNAFKKISITIFSFLLTASIASAAGYQFNNNLSFGMKNSFEVAQMQDFLRNLGFFSLPTSSGNYLGVTMESVKRFQIANNIRPVSGYFGPLTRAAANRLAGGTNPVPTTINPATEHPIAPPATIQPAASATSTYWGKITIEYANNYSDKPEDEYLLIDNTSTTSESISITGFKLTNSNGEEFTIPRGQNLAGSSAIDQDNIVLKQYDSAEIIAGRQDRQMNFRENLCTGYLNQSSNYHNKVGDNNCPRPNVSTSLSLPDHCISVIQSTPSCRTVDQSKIQIQSCIDYSEAHLNYQGCVNDFKNRDDFYSRKWLVWMQRPAKFLRSIHDKIILRDRDGKIVSVFTF